MFTEEYTTIPTSTPKSVQSVTGNDVFVLNVKRNLISGKRQYEEIQYLRRKKCSIW